MLRHADELLASPARAAEFSLAARRWAMAAFSTQALARQTEAVYLRYLECHAAGRGAQNGQR